jgi:hypothetical protein
MLISGPFTKFFICIINHSILKLSKNSYKKFSVIVSSSSTDMIIIHQNLNIEVHHRRIGND